MISPQFIERSACPICASEYTEKLYSSSFLEPPISDYLIAFYSPQGGIELDRLQGANYILHECLSCGLIYQRDILDEHMMNQLYEEWIDPDLVYNSIERNRNISYYRRLSREIELVIRHFQKEPSKLHFLDFGMGWGTWSRIANAYGCNAFGHEISPRRIEYAQKRGTPVLSWEQISHHKFDFINTEQVFEHIPKPFEAFIYLTDSLKEDGFIKISVPNGWGIKRKLKKGDWDAPKGTKNSLNPVAPLEHINCYSAKTLRFMAQKAGYVPIRIPASSDYLRNILDITPRDLLRAMFHLNPKFTRRGYGSTYTFFKQGTLK